MVRRFEGLAEFAAAAGEHLGFGPWHEVTQREVDLFAEATGTTSGSTWTWSALRRGRSGGRWRTGT